jgi:Phage protein (N4 Gp49/phage Sf6 gene 66) family
MSTDSDARISAGSFAPGAAPKITLQDAEAVIVKEDYICHGVLTICILEVKNGTPVTGESVCVYPENYDREVGQKIARQKAVGKIVALEGYLLAERRQRDMTYFAGN